MIKPTTSSPASTSSAPAPGQMFVTPAPGLKVRDPKHLQHLAPEGQLVPRDNYWLRRLADGDVIETQAPAAPRQE